MHICKKFIPASIKAAPQPHPPGRTGLRVTLACAITISLLTGVTSQAQVNTGTLSGQVTDSSGAVVGGACRTRRKSNTYTIIIRAKARCY